MDVTTRETIGRWFDEGVARGETHMLVRVDTFDYLDYPVYGSRSLAESLAHDTSNMARTMEVYLLKPELREEQLNARRNWRFE